MYIIVSVSWQVEFYPTCYQCMVPEYVYVFTSPSVRCSFFPKGPCLDVPSVSKQSVSICPFDCLHLQVILSHRMQSRTNSFDRSVRLTIENMRQILANRLRNYIFCRLHVVGRIIAKSQKPVLHNDRRKNVMQVFTRGRTLPFFFSLRFFKIL